MSVYKCVWVCVICFFVWRWRDYIISISSCLSFLLDDEVYVSCHIGEKSGYELVFMGYGGVGF